MSATYKRNPWLVPQWNADSADKVELVDSRSGRTFRVQPAVLGLLNRIPAPTPAEDLSLDGHTGDALAALLARMATAGLVELVEAVETPTDDAAREVPDLFADRGEWSACELAVHTQSSRGGKPQLRLADIPPARLTHPEALTTITLDVADRDSRPFADVLDERRSIRDFDTAALPVGRLAAFLDRAARVRGRLGPQAWQSTSRPSASGGGRHSVELYLLVRNVAGLEAGAYHYDPFAHALSYLQPWSDEHDTLQRSLLCVPMGVEAPPAVGLYLASYYRRAQCKYGGMTLSLIYRGTGALVQTLYLAAAELGLAGCATAAMQATPSPSFLHGYRDKCIHTGNFALALPAENEPHRTPLRRLES